MKGKAPVDLECKVKLGKVLTLPDSLQSSLWFVPRLTGLLPVMLPFVEFLHNRKFNSIRHKLIYIFKISLWLLNFINKLCVIYYRLFTRVKLIRFP